MTDRLTALRVFQRVAHRGSFSRAARDLGLSQPSVSRITAQLESEIGAALFVRSTRALALTDRGADYLLRIAPVLQALEEADHAVRGAGELRGALRVALASSFGVRELIPRLPAFLGRHPALSLDLVISDARHDLIAGGVDLALRLGVTPDANVVARKLGEAPRLLAASPAYLARAGAPATPADLATHAMIIGPGAAARVLRFAKDGKQASVRISGQLSIEVNEGATAAAVAGLGITTTSLWACRAELEAGTLVRVLPGWTMPPVEIHAIFSAGRAASPAARAFVDYVAGFL